MSGVAAALFDLDDTLALTEQVAWRATGGLIDGVRAELGLAPLPLAEMQRRFAGETLGAVLRGMRAEMVAHPRREAVLGDAAIAALVAADVERTIEALGRQAQPAPGALELVEALAASGVRLAVVSSSAEARIRATLRAIGLAEVFGERVFSAQCTMARVFGAARPKPDPTVYRFAARALGAAPERCLAVEDSLSGVRSAVAAGVPVVGFVGALPPAERAVRAAALRGLGAEAVVHDLRALRGRFGEGRLAPGAALR